MIKYLKEIYEYRSLLKNLIYMDQKVRYKNTLLGLLWSLLNPLLLMIVFIIVFGYIGRFSNTIPNYPLFLLTGLIAWQFMTSVLLQSAASLRSNSHLLLKVYFPRHIIPLSTVFTNMVNFILSLFLLFLLLIIFNVGFSANVLYLPVIVLCQLIMLIGSAYIISILSAYYNDFSYLLGIMLAMGFYVTPIFYPVGMVPDKFIKIFYFNPMVHFITAYHRILIYHKAPGIKTMFFIVLFTALIYLIGFIVFKKYQNRVTEVL